MYNKIVFDQGNSGILRQATYARLFVLNREKCWLRAGEMEIIRSKMDPEEIKKKLKQGRLP
jgi:hypothetical protein